MDKLKCEKAQALLEVAILGSILIVLLGILISYGLRFNFQQRLMQQAFRKALSSANTNSLGQSGAFIILRDMHIPSPANPFGVGSVAPVMSAAGGISRSPDLMQYATTEDELPRINLDLYGAKLNFTVAGFRYENGVSEDDVVKYEQIYGASNVNFTEGTGGGDGDDGGGGE